MSVAHVVPLLEEHIEVAGEALARSFFNDPLAVYMIPDACERARLLPSHFTPFVRYGHLFGKVLTTPTSDAAAVWLPSEVAEITPDRAARCGLDKIEAAVGSAAWDRFNRVMECVEQVHHSVVPGSHWYLALIGVDPSRQGHGVGIALLRAMLSRVDVDGLPCYLETFSRRTSASTSETASISSRRGGSRSVACSTGPSNVHPLNGLTAGSSRPPRTAAAEPGVRPHTGFTTAINSQKEHHGQVPDLFSKRGDGCARWRMGSGGPRRTRCD